MYQLCRCREEKEAVLIRVDKDRQSRIVVLCILIMRVHFGVECP